MTRTSDSKSRAGQALATRLATRLAFTLTLGTASASVVGGVAILSTILSAAGCASAPRQGETLIESLRTYHEGIRWQRYTAAAGRIPPAERAAFLDEWDARSQDLKITDYEIVDLAKRGDTAKVQVKISWYGDREGVLHDTHTTQIWRRRGKVWLLTDEVRMRGPAMPGLAEPSLAEPSRDGEGAADLGGGDDLGDADRESSELGRAAARPGGAAPIAAGVAASPPAPR
jgi:hypothetical protein